MIMRSRVGMVLLVCYLLLGEAVEKKHGTFSIVATLSSLKCFSEVLFNNYEFSFLLFVFCAPPLRM